MIEKSLDRKEPLRQATKALSSSGHAATHKFVIAQSYDAATLGARSHRRHDNLGLVVLTPEASPLHTKNFAPHRTPRRSDIANDVIKHVS
jgi:hypothetical protein